MYSSFRCAPASAPQQNNGGPQAQPAQAGARPLRRTSTANSLPPPEDESAPRDNKRKAADDPPVVARDGVGRRHLTGDLVLTIFSPLDRQSRWNHDYHGLLLLGCKSSPNL